MSILLMRSNGRAILSRNDPCQRFNQNHTCFLPSEQNTVPQRGGRTLLPHEGTQQTYQIPISSSAPLYEGLDLSLVSSENVDRKRLLLRFHPARRCACGRRYGK